METLTVQTTEGPSEGQDGHQTKDPTVLEALRSGQIGGEQLLVILNRLSSYNRATSEAKLILPLNEVPSEVRSVIELARPELQPGQEITISNLFSPAEAVNERQFRGFRYDWRVLEPKSGEISGLVTPFVVQNSDETVLERALTRCYRKTVVLEPVVDGIKADPNIYGIFAQEKFVSGYNIWENHAETEFRGRFIGWVGYVSFAERAEETFDGFLKPEDSNYEAYKDATSRVRGFYLDVPKRWEVLASTADLVWNKAQNLTNNYQSC